MVDWIIKNAKLDNSRGTCDVAVDKGRIIAIEEDLQMDSERLINVEGKILSPGFVESHMHLDKALTLNGDAPVTLRSAITEYTNYCASLTVHQYEQDIRRRARRIIRMALSHGTTAIRTHVNIEPGKGLAGIRAMHEVCRTEHDIMDIHITAMPNFFGSPLNQQEQFTMLEEACRTGYIQALGGAPYHFENYKELDYGIFELAERYGLRVDLHVDESDLPEIGNLEHIIELTKAYGFEGRVSCSHLTDLSAVADTRAKVAIQGILEADIHVVTLPSCNLYLMGRDDAHPVRRGVTRINELLEAGVSMSLSSDNIRDPYRPMGNANMLEEALLTAQVARMLTRKDLDSIYRMITEEPAKALGLKNSNIEVGNNASFIILDAEDTRDAIVDQVAVTHVFKNGRLVLERKKPSICTYLD